MHPTWYSWPLRLLAGIAAALTLPPVVDAAVPPGRRPPNIIVVLSDDQGYGDFSCHGNPNLPHQKGFDDAVYHLGWGITSMADTWCNDYFDGRFRFNGVLKQTKGYCTDVWFDLAMNWIRDRHKKNEPFFLYLPTNAP